MPKFTKKDQVNLPQISLEDSIGELKLGTIKLGRKSAFTREYDKTYLATYGFIENCQLDPEKAAHIEDIYLPDGCDLPTTSKLRHIEHADGTVDCLLIEKIANEQDGWLWDKTTIHKSEDFWDKMDLIAFRDRHQFPRVSKDRYRVSFMNTSGVLYVYRGSLSGLVTLSVRSVNRSNFLHICSDLYTANQSKLIDPKSTNFDGCSVAGQSYNQLYKLLERCGYWRIDLKRLGLQH